MGQCDNILNVCCEFYSKIPRFKFCPECGEPFKSVSSNELFILQWYKVGRLVAKEVYCGRLQDILEGNPDKGRQLVVTVADVPSCIKVQMHIESGSDTFRFDFVPKDGLMSDSTLQYLEKQLPDYTVYVSARNQIVIRRK